MRKSTLRTLGQIAESIDYGLTASAREGGGPRFLRITDLREDGVDWGTVPGCDAEISKSDRYCLKNGDIVFARTGATTGKSYLISNPPDGAVFASYLIRVRPKDSVLPGYLAHYFRSSDYWRQIDALSEGAAQPGVNATKLASIQVPVLDLVKQHRIVTILDKAVSLRRKRLSAIKLAEELLQAEFRKRFNDSASNASRMSMTTLGDVAKLKSGDFLPSHEMENKGDVFVYGGNGINGRHDKAMFDEVKLVIGRVGAYCGAVHLTKPISWVTDNALYVSEISPLFRLEYLAFALKEANLNQYSSRSGQPLVSASRLYPVEIAHPTLEQQDAFIRLYGRVETAISRMNESLREIEFMSTALSSSLLD